MLSKKQQDNFTCHINGAIIKGVLGMSDETKPELANDANANQDFDFMAEIERLKSQNERLLGESQKYKTRKSELDELKAELDAKNAKELEEKGSWQERLELEKKARLESEKKAMNLERRAVESNIRSKIVSRAKGVIDPEDLFTTREYKEMVTFDPDTLEGDDDAINSFIDHMKEKKPHFWSKKSPTLMSDAKPASTVQDLKMSDNKKSKMDLEKEILNGLRSVHNA